MPKKLIILCPYPKGKAPSQRFRFEQYLDQLSLDSNYILTQKSFFSEKAFKNLYLEGGLVQKMGNLFISFIKRWGVILFKIPFCDMVFIHREASPLGPPVFEWIIAKVWRKPIIYDFDDAIWLPNYSEANAKFHRLKAYWKIPKIIRWSAEISAGNEYLANYARQFNSHVRVIPTTIDTVNHHAILCQHMQQPAVIGWTGTHSTMPYLDFLIPILKELEEIYAFEFRVISNQAPHFQLKSLKFVPWNKNSEIEDLSKIQIGVMPLSQDQWAEGKCGFKGLQYMALEIASIMSPVGVNKTIIQNGVNGYLADQPEEWKKILITLLENPDLRSKIGKEGRKTVIKKYSIIANAPHYLKIIEDAVKK